MRNKPFYTCAVELYRRFIADKAQETAAREKHKKDDQEKSDEFRCEAPQAEKPEIGGHHRKHEKCYRPAEHKSPHSPAGETFQRY